MTGTVRWKTLNKRWSPLWKPVLYSTVGSVFSSDPEVIELTRVIMRLMAFYQAFDGFNIVFRGALNGAGDTRFTMAVTMVGSVVLFVPSVYVLALVLDVGLVGAWLGAITYILAIALVFFRRFQLGRWQHIELDSSV